MAENVDGYRPAPLVVRRADGDAAIVHRQCGNTYRVTPMPGEPRELAGVPASGRRPTDHRVTQVFGISVDEYQRMRDPDQPWIVNDYPLVTARMTRWDCLRWNADHNFPTPPRSACVFCPYHSDAEWRRLRDDDPAGWDKAVAFDAAIRDGSRIGLNGQTYVHRSLIPLAQVNLSTPEDRGQGSLFSGECEGMWRCLVQITPFIRGVCRGGTIQSGAPSLTATTTARRSDRQDSCHPAPAWYWYQTRPPCGSRPHRWPSTSSTTGPVYGSTAATDWKAPDSPPT